ncbi:KGG domain-containing protein [Nitrosovibrio sp. Nv17]|uniref:KGG domain-containing protein n=1 Tax=Nitrosovibrio sp. Nv17 TaxID=1855339 RepID=UPI002100C69C|nr:KGG domain-containing protein [Nitrosovibrio sp. Nv17]
MFLPAVVQGNVLGWIQHISQFSNNSSYVRRRTVEMINLVYDSDVAAFSGFRQTPCNLWGRTDRSRRRMSEKWRYGFEFQEIDMSADQDKNNKGKYSKRGFASMDKEKQRAIASKGGKAAHAKGTAHRFTPEEASLAGYKGGIAQRKKKQAVEASIQAEKSPRARKQ